MIQVVRRYRSLSLVILGCLLAMMVMAVPALAQGNNIIIDNSGNSDSQYQNQDCSVIVNQYNNAVAGNAVANGDAAVAAVAANVNAPVSVVTNCIQAGGDVNLGDGGGGNNPPDDGGNNGGNDGTDGNDIAADNVCPAGTTAGDATVIDTAGQEVPIKGGSFVVSASDVNENVTVTIEDSNGDEIDSSPVEFTEDGEKTVTAGPDETFTFTVEPANADATITVTDCVEDAGARQTASETDNPTQSDVMAATIPQKTLANTGGVNLAVALVLPASILLVGSGLLMASWLRRQG